MHVGLGNDSGSSTGGVGTTGVGRLATKSSSTSWTRRFFGVERVVVLDSCASGCSDKTFLCFGGEEAPVLDARIIFNQSLCLRSKARVN